MRRGASSQGVFSTWPLAELEKTREHGVTAFTIHQGHVAVDGANGGSTGVGLLCKTRLLS